MLERIIMDIERFLHYFARILTLLLVIPLHEAAHALVAKWCGDATATRQGRVSLNPFDHIDPIGALLMIMTGFGWAKPVDVNPARMKHPRRDMALTALAGPVSNLIAAFAAGLIKACILATDNGMKAYLEYNITNKVTTTYCVMLLMEFLMIVNIGLAVFNLLPIPPLDGFNVMRYFTGAKVDRWFYAHFREVQIGFLVFLLVLNMGIIPDKYNVLVLARNKIYDGMWDILWHIPENKWNKN